MNRVAALALAIAALAVAGGPAGCASPAEKADRSLIRERHDPGAEAIAGTRGARPAASTAAPAAAGRPVAGQGPESSSAAPSGPAPAQAAQAAPVTARPTRDGVVVAVRGESVDIDLGRDDGVVVGQRLRVVRPGTPLIHPVTGETLGAARDDVGQLEVTAVAEKFATARVARVEGGAAIEPKDRVVAGEPRVSDVAATERVSPAPAAAPAPAAPPPTAPALDPSRSVTSQELAYEIRGLAVADLDGDGRVEVITLNQSQLVIYRWTGRSLELLFEEEPSSRRNYISVDAADLDGDGRAELLVNDAVEHGVNAAILQQEGRRFVRRDLPRDRYFRILGAEVGVPTLVGQRRGDAAQPFRGDVYRYEWRRGKARRGEVLWTPVRASIFDLQLYRAAGGKVELAALSPTGHLRLFRGRDEAWSSQQELGGTKLRVVENNPARPNGSTGEEKIKTPIPGRIVPLPGVTGGTGEALPAFALPLNEKGSFVTPRGSFSKGSVLALAVDGPAARELWRTATFEGYVAALCVADLGLTASGTAGRALLIALDLQKGLFKAARSVIVVQPLS